MLGVAIALVALAGAAGAEPAAAPICTDRPGKSSSTCTVPKGMWQAETGIGDWSLTEARGTRSTSLAIGSTAVKYGLSDDLHVEVGFSPYIRNRERSDGERTTDGGFGDVTVKVKQRLTVADAALTAALVPFVKLPTASNDVGNGKAEGGLVVALSWSLSETVSLSS